MCARVTELIFIFFLNTKTIYLYTLKQVFLSFKYAQVCFSSHNNTLNVLRADVFDFQSLTDRMSETKASTNAFFLCVEQCAK